MYPWINKEALPLKTFITATALLFFLVATSSAQDDSIEKSTKIHRLSGTERSIFDAFVYINRIPERAEEGESTIEIAGRIFGRLANQEGRILLKLPPGMTQDAYLGYKTFLQYEGKTGIGNCVVCHTLSSFTDQKRHVVTRGGIAIETPSLRNMKRRKVDIEKVVMAKLTAAKQKQAGMANDIDDAYSKMKWGKKEAKHLIAFLYTLNDVSDEDFRELILKSELLDMSPQLDGVSKKD